MRLAPLHGAVLLTVVLLAACAKTVPPDSSLPDAIGLSFQRIPLSSQDPRETRVGRLVYRGGLVLTSGDSRFGGWSGLQISADGKHLLSQSDEAHFLKADLVYDDKGDLAGVRHGQLADMQDLDGQIMRGKEGDAEGLALLTDKLDGPVAISFERNNRVWEYDLTHGLDVRPTPVAMPDAIKTLIDNLGLETLTRVGPDTLLAVAEIPQQDQHGDNPAWLVSAPGKTAPVTGTLGVIPHKPYEISDGTLSPDGKHLYLLERHFYDPIRGVVIAVREIDAATIKPGARLDGEEIASFTLHENIDNMEGIAMRRGPNGETLVYLISDDNYNPVERTLLLMFELR
ncbi:MAG TPA: esterase-like activity of phytase family protein [Rhizomicrobium sp.]|jgi:hypothetical protein